MILFFAKYETVEKKSPTDESVQLTHPKQVTKLDSLTADVASGKNVLISVK